MERSLTTRLAALLRIFAIGASLLVLASFTVFAVDQIGAASTKTQAAINTGPTSSPAFGGRPTYHPTHDAVRSTIDDGANALLSPFDGVVSSASSQWLYHGVRTLLGLALYGFALLMLARWVALPRGRFHGRGRPSATGVG